MLTKCLLIFYALSGLLMLRRALISSWEKKLLNFSSTNAKQLLKETQKIYQERFYQATTEEQLDGLLIEAKNNIRRWRAFYRWLHIQYFNTKFWDFRVWTFEKAYPDLEIVRQSFIQKKNLRNCH